MAQKRAGEGILPAILLPCTIGIGFPSFQGHSQTRGCHLLPIPCPGPVLPPKLPPHVLCSPICLQPSALQGKESLLSMGCGKLLMPNKLQFLPKIITVMRQELGALLTQGIVFACVKKGWGQQLPWSPSATGQW